MRISRAALSLAAIVGISTLCGCGVPLQSTAEPLPVNAIPAPLPTSAAASEVEPSASTSSASPEASVAASSTGVESRLRLWFVQEDGLASTDTDLPADTLPEVILQSLAIGPTAVQVAEGLRTVARDPLTGMPLVSVASAIPTPATPSALLASGPPAEATTAPIATIAVQLAPAFVSLPSDEQILLLGQVVLSLTGADESAVAFTDDAGAPVAVPLPDGRLLDTPATARDYAGLIVKP